MQPDLLNALQQPTSRQPDILDQIAGSDAGSRPNSLGILVQDLILRRLLEGAAHQLDLTPVLLDLGTRDLATLLPHELLIADEAAARDLRPLIDTSEDHSQTVTPSLIAVRRRTDDTDPGIPLDNDFDGLLLLPQDPATLVAQLSVLLYAHRAFARRYQSALEELQLNRRIFRSVTSGISVANAQLPDLPLMYVNPAFELMTGYSLEEVEGKNCRFLQGPETAQPGITLLREAIAARREVVAIIRNFRKDGSPFWNELSLSPIRNRDGEVTHFVGIQSDITARVEFESALRQSEKLAAVGRLAASIAHEINNPLESVTNLLYLAARTATLDEARDFVAQADTEIRRVALITTQSLRFYKQSTRAQAIRFNELLQGVLELYRTRIESTGVSIHLRERMGESIVCLESEVRQVIANLIRNAADAMRGDPRGGRLLIRTRKSTDWRTGTLGVTLTVADTGTGIDAPTLAQLYTAFFTTKGIAGTGLGLWVSSEIVKRHHGRLLVRSSARTESNLDPEAASTDTGPRQPSKPGWTVFTLFLPFQGLAA